MNTLLRIAPAAVCARLIAASLVVAEVLPAKAASDQEGAAATPRVLNSFTAELLRLSRPTLATNASRRFTQPRTGWLWVRSEAPTQGVGTLEMVNHLENPDFADGTAGWLVDAPERGGVATKSLKGYGWLQGRYPRTSLGDTFLWTKRSTSRPNRVMQEIRNLRPSQLYSLKLVTADYQELERGKSVQQKHAVGLQITRATTIPEKSFPQPMANNYAHALGPFNEQNKAWMNYHYVVFRAEDQSATLTLSDWPDAREVGGPPGQELIYNVVELQPYLE